MTSGEVGNTEQNEYEDSFKRFKTLFTVGSACFCLGVIVVFLGNRFQLYEVQRLGIIFSSFGIGWIILAIAYLIYMKWCFTPGEDENSMQQSVAKNVEPVRPTQSKTLERPPSSSKMSEISETTEDSSFGRSFGRSISLAQKVERLPSESGLERPLHSARNFGRRSYSVRNVKSPSYSEKNCKRLSTSFKTIEKPLPLRKSFERHMALVNNMKVSSSSEQNFEKLPYSVVKLGSRSPEAAASAERCFERRTPSEGNWKMLSSSARHYEKPTTGLRNFERQEPLGKNIERQQSFANYFDMGLSENSTDSLKPAENSDKLSAPDKNFDTSPPYKTHLRTTPQDSLPPNYYEVVLSMPKTNDS